MSATRDAGLPVELAEIRDFIAPLPPFSILDAAALDALPRQLAIRYLRRGSPFPPPDEAAALYIVRKGAIEQRDELGSLTDMLAEGDIYDAPCLAALEALNGAVAEERCLAVEDTLLYLLPCPALQALRRNHTDFDAFFVRSASEHLRHAHRRIRQQPALATDLLTQAVGGFAQRTPVTALPSTSIREAATLMTKERVSALMIVEADRLVGILTDRDLRSRCLAAGLSPEQPVASIMSGGVASIGPEDAAFEALMTITRQGIHHLPVVDGSGVRGLVSATDLLRWQSTSAVHLASRIRRCETLPALAAASGELAELQLRMQGSGATAAQVGQTISSINDAIAARLIVLAERDLGPPPVPFAWAACGSQGRHEQTVHSDQDNALILHDDYRPERDGAWFTALAQRVNDGLDVCGFRYCPGQVMASTPAWRQPAAAWARQFAGWISHADDMAAMLAANFLDLRVIHGDASLLAPLHATVLDTCARHDLFIARMTANALKNRPPLGFFRNFLLAGEGEHADTFDIKRGGLIAITDLARIHALVAGRAEIGTLARLRSVCGSASLSSEGAQELEESFEFLGTLRLRHQAGQIRAGLPPDNHIAPASLTPLERTQLKSVFEVIARQQDVLGQRYGQRHE